MFEHFNFLKRSIRRFIEFKSRISFRFLLFLLIFLYSGFTFAYSLFYIPTDGRPIEITSDLYRPERRLFEKVDVIEAVKKSMEDYSALQKTPQSAEINRPQEGVRTPQTSQVETGQMGPFKAPSVEMPAEQQPPKRDPVAQQQKPKLISTAEVSQLSSKFGLSGLGDNSIIELRITQSYGEVFTVSIQSGIVHVAPGESSYKDLEIWIDRAALEEILGTNDVSYMTKRLAGEGKISVIQKTSTWTLYRKGYKSLAEKLGLI